MNDSINIFNQYEEDYKLKHVQLEKFIWYYDEEKEEFTTARLELFGHSFELKVEYENKVIKSTSSRNTELVFQLVSHEKDRVALVIGSDVFISVFASDFEILKKHYEEMNVEIPKLRKEFQEDVYARLPQLLNDQELVSMTLNFIEDAPPIFVSPVYIVGVERILDRRDNIGKLVLLSNEDQRSSFSIDEDLQDALGQYVINDFNMLEKLIQERHNILNSPLITYRAYVFLYDTVIKCYSKKWIDEHGGTFTDIKDLDLESAVQRYCSIDTIEHDNTRTAGTFVYYLIDNRKFENENRNFIECVSVFFEILTKNLERKKYQNFVKKISNSPSKREYAIDDVDLMTGQEFEQFVALLFSKMGYETEVTKASGDQGVDVLLSKNGIRIGVQAKCYSGTVGNGAIQEAVAGKEFYGLDKVMVVTNSLFTDAAQKLANANSVVLWDRNILKEKILEIFSSSPE